MALFFFTTASFCDPSVISLIARFTGGVDTVTRERRWAKIANKLGYPSGRSVGSILKNHYERILYPFDVFKQGKTLSDIVRAKKRYLVSTSREKLEIYVNS